MHQRRVRWSCLVRLIITTCNRCPLQTQTRQLMGISSRKHCLLDLISLYCTVFYWNVLTGDKHGKNIHAADTSTNTHGYATHAFCAHLQNKSIIVSDFILVRGGGVQLKTKLKLITLIPVCKCLCKLQSYTALYAPSNAGSNRSENKTCAKEISSVSP